MKVSELMTRDVEIANPNDTIEAAARLMAKIDAGVLPVGEENHLVGMITDRDITIKGVASGKDPKSTKVRDVMTGEIKYCFEDEDVDRVADNMADLQLRRLPVVNRDKRLVGIVSLGDIATGHKPSKAGEALSGISQRH
ncbi:MAG TPA: CBS domain-containing protein [Alphaproteobacteria bacterium]|nr:CBS domain-containing protein [Alphaproteobacteria bacterium]